MIKNIDDYLISIVFGIDYRANFSIEDKLGQIVDGILYSKSSYFSPDYFPEVISEVGVKTLINKQTDDIIKVTNSKLIFQISFDKTFQKNDYNKILEKFNSEIINGVLSKFKIKNIFRTGFIHRYLFPIENLATNFVHTTIGNTISGINDVNLTFSRKIPLERSLAQRDVNDWDNAIINVIKKSEIKEIYMSLDYQHYYDPPLEKSERIEFKSFVSDTQSYIDNNFLHWINSNYLESK